MENLICKNVGKSYKEKTVLKNVNLELEPGKIYGLIGRNGAVIPDVRLESRIGCRQQVTQF